MADETLQDLARAVAGGAPPSTRLRYARALERAGRRDEAVEALLPAREELIVRHELAALPGYGLVEELGGSADVPPVRRGPRLTWFRQDVLEQSWGRSFVGFATPLALVAMDADRSLVHVLDPDTGELRRTLPGRLRALADLIHVEHESRIAVACAWTGKTLSPRAERRREERLPGARHPVLVSGHPEDLAATERDTLLWRREGVRLPWRTEGPPIWSYRTGAYRTPQPTVVGDRVIVDGDDQRVTVLDLATGITRATIPGALVAADRDGVLVEEERAARPESCLSAFDLEGRRVFRVRGWLAFALLPGEVVAMQQTTGERRLLSRATGEPVGPAIDAWFGAVVARRALYHVARPAEVSAIDLDTGATLWRADVSQVFGQRAGPYTLVPGWRRVYVLGPGGVAALEEA